MAGPSGKKDGLRCDCGKLLLEKDPEMGLGVRCGRRECDKFHPLEEINQRAAEFPKEKRRKERKEMLKIEKDIPRGEVFQRLNDLMLRGEIVPEDVPQLVSLMISRAAMEKDKMLKPTHCGACNQGVFIPVLRGYIHPKDQMFERKNLYPATLTICDSCEYIREEK